jgi:hypothetical protein
MPKIHRQKIVERNIRVKFEVLTKVKMSTKIHILAQKIPKFVHACKTGIAFRSNFILGIQLHCKYMRMWTRFMWLKLTR